MPTIITTGSMAASAFGFARNKITAAVDSFFNYVTLLLNGDGTNGAQNNTFLDSSTNNFTITRNGNTTQGSFSPYGTLWSNYFDGTAGTYLSGPTSSIPAGTFTVSFWVYPTAFVTGRVIFAQGSGSNNTLVLRYYDTAGDLTISQNGVWASIVGPINLNSWNYITLSKNSSNDYLMTINGEDQGSVGNTAVPIQTSPFNIGAQNGANVFSGYISNFKTTNVATAQGNITLPTTPATATTGTKLLTCQSNRFIDNSTNNATITVNGTPQVQRFSPFNPTSAYSTSVIGGSMYDPGGTYLTTSSTSSIATNGDFTVEGWFNLSAYPSNSNIVIVSADLSIIAVQNNGQFSTYMPSSGWVSHGPFRLNQWNYCVVQRSGGTVSSYLNGTRLDTYSASEGWTYNTLDSLVGQSNVKQVGYYSNIRISNIARYSGTTMTVPTAPTTSDGNTTFLLNMTNAGIPDLAMQNNLQTVGSAQVSTSVKKFGTGSLSFGDSNYLTFPTNNTFLFGTADFTIEFWMYPTDINTSLQSLFSFRNPTVNNFEVRMDNPGQLQVHFGGSLVFNASTNISSNNTWNYVALCRSNGTLRLYLNGTSVGSTSTTYNANQVATTPTIGGAGAAGDWWYYGYIDDFRVTSGYARYSGATMTVPTAALPTY
jgi:Concanavalin A-like lectin/glucanases superfamily